MTLPWQKTVLQGSSFDLYAPVEDSLNGLERLAGEPIVAYTTDPQRSVEIFSITFSYCHELLLGAELEKESQAHHRG